MHRYMSAVAIVPAFLAVYFTSPPIPAIADAHSPWVVSQHVADTSSLRAFSEFHAWKNKQGQDRAIAIWRYLCSKETGVFHFAPIREGSDRANGVMHIVRDPITMLNSYGYGFCGAFGPTAAGIFEKTGFAKARAVSVPGCNHAVTEVWYDGGWHYYDVDLRGLLFARDGKTVASVEDASQQPGLWTNPVKRISPFFPADPDLTVYARTFATPPVDYLYSWATHASTMDYRLRQGESFTRWWRPQDGRWSFQESDAKSDWWKRLLERSPRGAKSNHADFSMWTHGNGLFDYQPVLRKGCSDYQDGVFDEQNIELAEDGLTLATPGEAHVIFEVLSPYVIVPQVNRLETREDDCEASVVSTSSRGSLEVGISLDFGRSWIDVATVSGEHQVELDLTPYLRERYQYLVRFTLKGQPGKTTLRSLGIRTWVQVAPASLPRLKAGVNRLRYKTGDQYSLPTTPWLQLPNMADRKEMSRYWTRPPRSYVPEKFQRRVRGELELEFTAPPGRTIKWASLGGYFATHQGSAAKSTKNEIWYAVDDQDDWRQLYRADVPQWVEHWHYAVDREVMLNKGAKSLRVRYVGRPAVNGIRVNLHSEPDEARSASNVNVVHGFEIGGRLVKRSFQFSRPTEYEIDCSAPPRNIFIAFSVPSDCQDQRAATATEDVPPLTQTAAVAATSDTAHDAGRQPRWVKSMRAVHAKFSGEQGVLALFGDSITDSRAFWFGLPYSRKNASPKMEASFKLVNGYMKKECWDRKGPQFGNQGGKTIRWAHNNVDRWLKELNPEVALIMFGSNDLNSLGLEEYASKTRAVVQKCLDNGTVVILSTIPPRHRFEEKSAQFAQTVRKIARDLNVPLIDLHGEILKRRPADWNGALEKFSEYQGYDVPTLIARDGVHPSNPKQYRNDYSEEALSRNGFALRNYVSLLQYAEVIERVLLDGKEAPGPSRSRE